MKIRILTLALAAALATAVAQPAVARPDALARAELAEAPRALLPDAILAAPEDDGGVLGINKCGQAACLCTGSFCADLIDAGYCEDFHCASEQCICIF